MNPRPIFVDAVNRFSLDRDEETGRTFVSIPVQNAVAEYSEWYEIDAATFEQFLAAPARAHDLVARARRRELDHLLLFPPGRDRGVPA